MHLPEVYIIRNDVVSQRDNGKAYFSDDSDRLASGGKDTDSQ